LDIRFSILNSLTEGLNLISNDRPCDLGDLETPADEVLDDGFDSRIQKEMPERVIEDESLKMKVFPLVVDRRSVKSVVN